MADGAASLLPTAGCDGEDRISALHDDLLCAIISRLSVTDAAGTTALSPRWRHLWHSTPLVLDDVDLHESARDAIVSWVLADHPGPFRAVRLAGCSLNMIRIDMSDHDLECLIAAIPVLKTLVLARNEPKHVRLRSQSLHCVVVDGSPVKEVAVMETPLLDRLILVEPPPSAIGGAGMRVKITCAPNLRVFGYLEPRAHKLQIGDDVIEPNIIVCPRTVLPGVKILALRVNFGVFEESLLHDPSVPGYEPTGEHHAKFWQEASPIKCLRSHVKRMVIHKYQGHQNEFEFLKFISKDALELHSLVLVPPKEKMSLPNEVFCVAKTELVPEEDFNYTGPDWLLHMGRGLPRAVEMATPGWIRMNVDGFVTEATDQGSHDGLALLYFLAAKTPQNCTHAGEVDCSGAIASAF
uniref:Uncharacterized protein n=1 Tax=Aegilops tauschii TaxID=37682 RepID=M8C9Q7_AEGTA